MASVAPLPVVNPFTIDGVKASGFLLGNVVTRYGENCKMYGACATPNAYACFFNADGDFYLAVAALSSGIASLHAAFPLYRQPDDTRISSSEVNFARNDLGISGAYSILILFGGSVSSPYGKYPDRSSAAAALTDALANVPISYRLTNCSAPSAPTVARSGQIVTVNFDPAAGCGFTSPSDVYVTNDGVVIASTFTGNTLTFTMP